MGLSKVPHQVATIVHLHCFSGVGTCSKLECFKQNTFILAKENSSKQSRKQKNQSLIPASSIVAVDNVLKLI